MNIFYGIRITSFNEEYVYFSDHDNKRKYAVKYVDDLKDIEVESYKGTHIHIVYFRLPLEVKVKTDTINDEDGYRLVKYIYMDKLCNAYKMVVKRNNVTIYDKNGKVIGS